MGEIPKVAVAHPVPQNLESPVEERVFFGKLMWVLRLPLGPRLLGLRESASAKKGVKTASSTTTSFFVFRAKADSDRGTARATAVGPHL